ncbi:hypothetical protein Bhyg_00425 [Pseudolycoriella hygida]|uniref:Uncharacterized protein n=1 Tax=Pseudolycoriella hygida TaxID=35572 RepID=A0A9Q0N7I2_9DIPT|nr:hypothetical protein Bhyg_00425 [Pseudolycoriella hygida]
MELPNIETCNRRKIPLLDLATEVIDNGDEKSDIDPENVKKISCDATPVGDEIIDGNKVNLFGVVEVAAIHSDTPYCDKREETDKGDKSTSESSKAFAFTIDFSEGKPVDSKKFNDIVERFQKRHRRGVSLGKMDGPTQPVTTKTKPPLKKTEQKSLEVDKGVKLRDKSQLNVGKESELRHSWSPRTSLSVSSKGDDNVASNIAKFVPKSATLQLALKDVCVKEKFKIFDMTPTDEVIDDFVCPQPPLEFDKRNSDNESVSEAGTYTLDGDNYTEEQKAMMNIDKLPNISTIICQEQVPPVTRSMPSNSSVNLKPKHEDLEIIDLEPETIQVNRNHIFQTSSTHDVKIDKPKTSYLEKLKSKVRTIGDRAFHKNKSPDKIVPSNLDIGNFTSVTASGVFSKKSSLDNALPPRMTRKNSLTKSHIDSSEYIQRSGHVSEKLLNSYTDYEKARHHEYQLNIFSQDCCTDNDKENGLGIKTAETKDDWIHEWARNARRNNAQHLNTSRNDRAQSEAYTKQNYQSDEFGDNLERNYSPKAHKNRINRYPEEDSCLKSYRPKSPRFSQNYHNRKEDKSSNYDDSEFIEPAASMTRSYSERKENYNIQSFARPPISPTKIPSPMHSMTRPRSSSLSRSVHSSNTDLDKHDTEMYLQKTAAAISTLQNIHRNSPQSPLSPARPKIQSNLTSSPSLRRSQQRKAIPPTTEDILYGSSQSLHKRNLSLDGNEYKPKYQLRDRMSSSYNDEGLNTILNLKHNHTRHNSYEDKTNHRTIDQTFAPQITMRSHISSASKQQVAAKTNNDASRTPTSQIKRSSSFTNKHLMRPSSTIKTLTPKSTPKTSNSSLQKSASSNSFKTMASKFDDNLNNEYYLNDEDDLDPNIYTSDSELSDMDNEKELITNTRYNKAFLIRLEQNKQKASAVPKQGSLACPNTPEMPRRGDARARTSLRERQSMPRDSSINRMKQDIPALNATKKSLTAKEKEPVKKVIPKYLDISKYKPSQGNTFLKRDESKSTLVNKEIKRSTSAFMNKSDIGRSSIRSVKSATSTKNNSTNASNAKEVELAMWRKRASYDPMKAAAEGKKKQELARRSSQQSKYCDNSSVVLRSQSFHSGVGQLNQRSNHVDDINRWTLISTESSEDEFLENS